MQKTNLPNRPSAGDERLTMLAEHPVPRVLLKMSLPMMISFFVQAMYNIVDSIFVARISEHALTAVSLAFPMQQIVTAVAVGAATGVSAVWSRSMGAGETGKASGAIRTMTALVLGFSVLFLLLGWWVSGPLFRAQTDVTEIAAMGTTYLTINWVCAFGILFGIYYQRLLVSAGRAVLSMAAMIVGAAVNLVLDPLLIFGPGPFPAMGIAGAAAATVAGQIVSAVAALLLNFRLNGSVRHDLLKVGFHAEAALSILKVGLPTAVTMGLSSLIGFWINQILLVYSTTATAVYGVWMKLQNFSYMPVFGLNNGLIPILSYNYGTKRLDRVRQAMKLSLAGCAVLMGLLSLTFECIPGAILTLFNAGEQMREIGTACLRACVISLPFGAVTMIFSTSMQSLDHSRYAMALNLLRQCVLLLGSFALFSALTRSQMQIWWAVPVTEVLTFGTGLVLYRLFRRHLGI